MRTWLFPDESLHVILGLIQREGFRFPLDSAEHQRTLKGPPQDRKGLFQICSLYKLKWPRSCHDERTLVLTFRKNRSLRWHGRYGSKVTYSLNNQDAQKEERDSFIEWVERKKGRVVCCSYWCKTAILNWWDMATVDVRWIWDICKLWHDKQHLSVTCGAEMSHRWLWLITAGQYVLTIILLVHYDLKFIDVEQLVLRRWLWLHL